MNDEDRKLLGLPPMKALRDRFLAAVRGAEAGVSVREMHRRNPDAPLEDWMRAGATMSGVRQEWSPVKNDMGAAQESRYFIDKPIA